MSTLKTANIGNNSGGPTRKVDDVVAGTPRAWVNFNGSGTVSIRSSFNVSSITDNGTGDYTVNFTNALSDANYAAVTGGGNDAVTVAAGNVFWGSHYAKTTTAYRLVTAIWGGGSSTRLVSDFDHVEVAIFR